MEIVYLPVTMLTSCGSLNLKYPHRLVFKISASQLVVLFWESLVALRDEAELIELGQSQEAGH